MDVRIASLVSSGSQTMAASTSATISVVGIFRGVGGNFGPFSRMERSSEESGLLDRLTTQLYLLTGVDWFVSLSLLRFVNFLACLASIAVRTE